MTLTPRYRSRSCPFFFFFNDTATTEIYTLSLHDALPICVPRRCSSAARWHGYQVSQRAFANREQGGDARRRGVRLDGCACDIRPGAHLVTAHTFDGRHPAVGQAVTIRRRFAVSRHSMMRTSGLRRLGGYFTESLLIACRYCRRPPPTGCQWPWRTSGRQHIDRGPGACSTRLPRRRDNPRPPN